MAVDFFLKIEGIEGESEDDVHSAEIDITNFKWRVSQPGSSHEGGGGGTGKAVVEDLIVTKKVDKSSPILLKLCCGGKHFEKAQLTTRKAGGKPIEYLKLEMSNGLITEVSSSGAEVDDRVGETVRMSFESFKYIYTPQDAAGEAGGEIPLSWNIAKNCEE